MSFFFDHLAAVFVASALMLVFAAVQQRGQQSAIAVERQHAVKTGAQAYLAMLERDVENMGSRVDRGAYTCVLKTDGTNTTLFHFSALDDPRSGTPRPETVTYRLEASRSGTGARRSVRVNGTPRPLYHLARSEGGHYDAATGRVTGGTSAGGGRPIITQFAVTLKEDGTGSERAAGDCSSVDVGSVEVSFLAALQSVEEVTAGQEATSHTNTSRYGITLAPPGMERLFP